MSARMRVGVVVGLSSCLVLGGSVAWAAVPRGSAAPFDVAAVGGARCGEHGDQRVRQKRTGVLRVASTCKANERKVVWSKAGP